MNAAFVQDDNQDSDVSFPSSSSSSSSSSLGDISDPDDDSSLDSNRGSFEFLQQQKFFRRLQALRRNSPTETTLDLSYFHIDAREWTTHDDDDEMMILDEPVTIAELRRVHEERSWGCPTTLDCLAQTIHEGCGLLNKLTLKESLMTGFPVVLVAAIFDMIATSKTLATFNFFGLTTELNDMTAERRTFVTALLNALAMNKSIKSLEIRRIPFDDESLQRLLTKDDSNLQHLEMVECWLLHVSEQGLLDAFSHNTGLVSLHWQGNQPFMMNALLRGLEQHEQLKDLSLFANDAGTMNGEALGRAVANCPALESFFWSGRYSFGPNADFDLNGFFRALRMSQSMRKVALRVQASAVVPSDDEIAMTTAPLLEELDMSLCEWSTASRESTYMALPASRTMDLSSSIFRRGVVDTAEALPAATWWQLFHPTKAASLEKLDLRNCGLCAGDVRQVAQFLRQPFNRLKELDLSFNRFEMGDLQNIIDALEHESHLEVLGLCGPIDVDQHSPQRHGFSLMAQLLCNAPNLRSIDLTDSNLFVGEYTDQEEEEFTNTLANHSTLKSINIDGVWLSPRQCRTFMVALRGSLTIQNFSARYHNFALYLEDLDIGFADVLNENTSLKTLDLEQSTQSPPSAASLLRGIQHHGTLRSVHLGTIDCHDAFLGQLCEMLRQNRSMTTLSMRLRKWSLPEMEIFYREFFTCLADFPSLREIDVHDGYTGHPILRTTGETLLHSLEKNTAIESISVSLAFLPYELHDRILYYLRLNQLGRRLLMSEKMRRTTSLWPQVLGKMTDPRDVRYLHYFLHHLETTELLIHHR